MGARTRRGRRACAARSCRPPPGRKGRVATRRSGVEDLALLQLELGVVEDARLVQLAQLAQLGELGVRVGPGLLRRLLLRRLLLRLPRPLVALAPGDAVRDGR